MSTVKHAPKAVSALAALILGCSAGTVSAAEGEWDWSIALYAWMAGLNDTIYVNDREVGEIDMSFSDILDDLDMTLMLHGEGFRDQWGFFADYLYLGISDEDKGDLATVDSSVDSTIFELAGVYRPSGRPEGFEAFAGLRYFSMDIELDITTPAGTNRTRSDSNYTDFMVGARYTGLINENWFYRLRADASGGSTEGTWNLVGSAGYIFGKKQNMNAVFGYRHLEIDLEDDQGPLTVRNDLKMSGPFVAFNYRF
jgi:hypothetical protein